MPNALRNLNFWEHKKVRIKMAAYKALCKYHQPRVSTSSYGEKPHHLAMGEVLFRDAVLKKLVDMDTYARFGRVPEEGDILCSIEESYDLEVYSELLPFVDAHPFRDEKKHMIFETVFANTTFVCKFAFSKTIDPFSRPKKGPIKCRIHVHLLS